MSDAAAGTATEGAQKPKGKMFYGWWIVIGGFLMMCTCYASYANCLPLFQAHIVEALGMTIGQYNTGTSLASIIGIVATLFIGILIDKAPARALCSTLVILGGLMLFGYGSATQPWQIYVLAACSGVAVTIGLRLAISVVITNWFNLKRGLAVSLALCGSGFGGAILSTPVSYIISAMGYRMAFYILGVIVLVVSLPIPLILYRTRPSDIGLQPYGAELSDEEIKAAEAKGKKQADPDVNVAVGLKVLLKSASFWLLVIGFLLIGTINGAVTVNIVSNMTVVGGHSTVWAGYVQSYYMALVLVFKVLLGHIFDRLGCVTGSVVASIACAIACVFLCFPETAWGPILAGTFFAMGTCIATIGPSIMITRTFGRMDVGTATGIAATATGFGGIIGAIVSGQVYDATGTFNGAWIFCVVCSLLLLIALVASVKSGRKLVQKRIDAGAPLIDEDGKIIEGSLASDVYGTSASKAEKA